MSKRILTPRLNQLAASIALVAGGLALVPAAHAAAPAAGSNISNQATASYTDATNTPRTVQSNTVTATVIQVGAFTLYDDRTATLTPNTTASLSHTLTNTGNGPDTYAVSVGMPTGSLGLTNVNVYLDADNNGVADNQTPVTTVSLNAGQSVGLIVVSTAPATASAGQQGQYVLTVTSSKDPSTETDTDTITATTGAAVAVDKSASFALVAGERIITYTLTYKNTGNEDATNVVLQDQLDLTKVSYVVGSAKWSASGSTALTDTAGGDPTGINYQIDANGKISIGVATVAKNSTSTVTFQVKMKDTTTTPVYNTASIFNNDDDGNPTTIPTGVTPINSNTTVVDPKIYRGTINDSATDTFADGQTPATPVGIKDDIIKLSTTQGTPVVFGKSGSVEPIVIHNTGATQETYNISYSNAGLPTGSVVEFFKADGATPLTDTNNDGVIDSGPIGFNASVNIVVKVTLPAGYSKPTADDSVGLVVTVKPVSDAAAPADTVKLVVSQVTAATVDLFTDDGTNTTTGANGTTPGATGLDVGSPVITKAVNPGQQATFPLAVTNSGANADNFNLSNGSLPVGWTVVYYQDTNNDGIPDGSPITNTGNVPAGQTVHLVAVVTPPSNAPKGDTPVVFTVTSPSTGLTDSMTDQVTVKTSRALALTSDNTGQVAPGGTVTYIHTLTNNGTITEGAGGTNGTTLPFTLPNSQAPAGWNASIYVDLNGNNIADPTELALIDASGNGNLTDLLANYDADGNGIKGLEAGQSVKLIVKVEAPANAAAGVQNTTILTVSPTANSNGDTAVALTNTDLTTVNFGQVRLLKEQAVDTDCDGNLDAGGSYTDQNTVSAKPGQCVLYRITATNDGNQPVTNVVINDATPYYTKISTVASNDGTVGTPSATPAVGGTGNVSNNVGGLAPTASAKLKFGVKIDQ